MDSVGDRLRRERQKQGRDLAQIASETRISQTYLAAIEADQLKQLPGLFFARSFVMQYAKALGLSEQEISAELGAQLEGETGPYIPGQEPPREGSDLPPIPGVADKRVLVGKKSVVAVGLLLATVAACTGLYALWLKGYLAMPLARLGLGQTSQQVAADAGTPAPPPPAAQALPPAPPAGNGLSVLIAAREKTWVSVTSNGKLLFTGILEPNQTKLLEGLEQARLLIGNAGGLDITSNGKPIGPIGPSGQVRVVVLTPEGSEILLPKKTPPPEPAVDEVETSPTG